MVLKRKATQKETHANALGIGVKCNTGNLVFELQCVWYSTNRFAIPKIRVVALDNVRRCLHDKRKSTATTGIFAFHFEKHAYSVHHHHNLKNVSMIDSLDIKCSIGSRQKS